ncbi:MAG: methyl-accepting chemotaxis protein [Clostridia bacterium]|nr:methyl-accepting chemotaxis protein [Clostridia bacterium]
MNKANLKLSSVTNKKRLFFIPKLKFKNSILWKLSISFSAIIAITLVFVGIITSDNTKKEVKSQFISSAKQILKQNQNYVDFIVTTVESNSNQLFDDADIRGKITSVYSKESEKYKAASDINKKLRSITLANSMIDSIYILNPEHISVREPQLQTFDINMKEGTDLYKQAVENPGLHLWIPPHFDELGNDKEAKVISDIRFSRDFGVLMINISPKSFQEALSKTSIGKEGYMFITDKNGNILSHPDSSQLGANIKETEPIKRILTSGSQQGNFTYQDSKNKRDMFAVYTTSEKTGWNYIAVVPNRELTIPAEKIRNLITIISMIGLLLSILVSVIISSFIIKPIKLLNTAMEQMEKGDLTVVVRHKSKDEFGELIGKFNTMIGNLKELVISVKAAVEETNETSVRVERSSGQLSVSAAEVHRAIEEIATGSGSQAEQAAKGVETSEVFGKEMESLVSYSGEVYSTSMDAMHKADHGMKSAAVLKDKSNTSVGIIRDVSESISELSQNTKEIEDVLKAITGISQQTNLLSLNASIEAARAGEAGKGFAVVADEVRQLAEASKQATDKISMILKNVNTRTRDSVDKAKSITVILEEQAEHIKDTMSVFEGIKGSIDIVGNKLNRLNGALDNINNEKSQLLISMEEISAISQETAASTEEISASAEEQAAAIHELNSMANGLKDVSMKLKALTDRFKIE